MNLSAISNDDKTHLARQLADHVTNWRQNIPPQMYAGNLCFQNMDDLISWPDITLSSLGGLEKAQFIIRGMLGEGLHCQNGIASPAEYYKLRLDNKLKTLENDEMFAPNRGLVDSLKAFIQKVLPTVNAIKSEDESFVFTHYDLSPRNILVSGQPLQITGIVDFEFSGFFPTLDEFLSDCIANSGDWPKDMYEVYLKRLESSGIPTPLEGIEKTHWEQMSLLEELVEKIAPWWLPGEYQGEQLADELKKVKVRVEEILAKLDK
ncbi:hypothetical protein IL306_009000 [Fusarium sp. DS 682]|nr:hypothetical protein IL306_009000 [Fusarium sp. DS 682]